MKKRTRNLKLISFIMSVIFVLLILPLSTIAYALENRYETLNEVVELRDENTKHFENPDGSYTAIMYNNAVHRKDSNGNWQDIDNTMSETEIKNKQAYITSDGRITFAKKIKQDENEIYTLSENGYRITVSFANENIKSSNAKLSNHASKYTPSGRDDLDTQFKKVKQIDNNTTLLYKNTLKGIDLEYVLSSNNVKENIIVKRLQDEYSYTFIYSLENLVATLNEDGSVSLFDNESGEERYSIPVPYMYDANGNLSYEVEYSLELLENGDYALTVTANSDWISSAKLPVVIDPTTAVTEQFPNVFDTYIDSNRSNVNFGSSDYLYISNTQITYMRPAELIALPDRATVTNAELNVYYYFPNSTNANTTIGLYPVTIDWNENQLTWYSAGSYSQMGIDFSSAIDGRNFAASSSYTAASPGNIIFNITDLYKNAYAGSAFYGVALYRSYGSTSPVVVLSSETSSRAQYLVTYEINAPIASGEYYIGSDYIDGMFMIALGEQNLMITDITSMLHQRWEFEYLHNGYYKITNMNTNLSLAIPNNKTAVADSIPSFSEFYEPIGRKQWKIVDAGEGVYKISPRSNESMFLSLATNNSSVQQRAEQTDNKDEWRLLKIGTSAYLLAITDSGHDHHTILGKVMDDISKLGCDEFNCMLTNSIIVSDVKSAMSNSKIFVSRSHGSNDANGTMIALSTSNSSQFLHSSDIYNFSSNVANVNLSNCDLMLFIGCETANHETKSLPQAAVLAGARVAVGFESTVFCERANTWTEKFFDRYEQGFSVEESCAYATQECISIYGNAGGLDSYVVVREGGGI